MKKRKPKPSLVDDIRASLEEAKRWARGEKTSAIVHTVVPSAAKARMARNTLGLPQPKTVRRAFKGQKAS